ncbi:DUF805 domain-containing protein [Campylobacter sp. VBCF_06 NA8]|uniref:DUF805 domain-containing protein n=1 Tax=Campylobacter sp. VBCF_06 NA8 TaxID=2983822 RepID=UPI0022E9E6B0|nr:DUF805 domain-containing protein [Campylobacter sp. VBCF_06 NA8]MDA3045668.1 DUF805 domain-containing protein [Campylobacter sp. VBCF_06 NA8]
MMSFGEAISVCLKQKFATFSGRASRSEYWWFYLFCVLVNVATSVIDAVLGTNIVLGFDKNGDPEVIGIVASVVAFGLLVPSFAVLWRRLHDRDISGWYFGAFVLSFVLAAISAGIRILAMLFLFVAVGLIIFIFISTILKGTDGANKYGDDPLNPRAGGNIFVP